MSAPRNAGGGDKEQVKADFNDSLARVIDVANDLRLNLLVAPKSEYRDAAYHALDAATPNIETALRFAVLSLKEPTQ